MLRGLFIVAGHGLGATGAIDNGASGFDTNERQEVVQIAHELTAALKADADFQRVEILPIGVEERMTLKDKIGEVNTLCRFRDWTADECILLSLHINAAGNDLARGIETWYSLEEGTQMLALKIATELSIATQLPLRRTPTRQTDESRFGRLGIIDDTIPRGCLIENGFLSNEFDAAALRDSRFDDRFAQGIHSGLRTFLELDATPQPLPLPRTFRDVPEDAWYHDDVALCLQQGLFQMSSSGLFHPSRPVTRAELAAVMARHLREHHSIS